MNVLRTVLSILASLCVVAVFPVGIFWDAKGALFCIFGALLLFGATLLIKNVQQKKEIADQPPLPDFFHPVEKREEMDEKKD